MMKLSNVLNYMDGVSTYKVGRWEGYTREHRGLDGDPIWDDESKMEKALAAVVWAPGSAVPTAAEVLAHVPVYRAYWEAAQITNVKTDLEHLLRTDPDLQARIALDARAEGKTVDEIIFETVTKV